jgi:hypothetical protein
MLKQNGALPAGKQQPWRRQGRAAEAGMGAEAGTGAEEGTEGRRGDGAPATSPRLQAPEATRRSKP